MPKDCWVEGKAVSGFLIRGMERYCGRGFGVVGYGTNKKEHLRAVALAGAVAAAALSEPGLDWKQHGDMFPVLVKAVQLELSLIPLLRCRLPRLPLLLRWPCHLYNNTEL